MKYKRLPDGELTVMMAIWDTEKKPVSRSMIEGKIADKNWNVNTVNTFLLRLTEKGALSCEKIGKTNYYTPLYEKDDYLAFESKSFLERLYGNSLGKFVTALSSAKSIDKKDIEELENFLEKVKED